MGSENSSLRGFTLQDPPWTQPSGLTIFPALLAEGRPASVFVYQPEHQHKVDKAAKHLKTLRHPCLLRFLSCAVEEDGIYLITEQVQPLEMLLEKLSTDEICAGIYDILQALVFLHDRGKVSHNNVCPSSVFVSEDGHWKLGGMEMVCNLSEVSPESAEFGIIPMALSHARDAFSFGRLIESLLAHVNDQSEPLSSFNSTVINSLLNPEAELRPALSTLLSHDFFRNDFLEVVNFLESLTVKTEEEKNEFFKFLLDRVLSLSEELISSRLVPLLLNQLVFAEPVAVKSFLPHLLRPKRGIMGRTKEDCLLSPALFQSWVIPELIKMFEVHEEHVRVVLLSHIDAYGELFSLKELKDIILPQVLLGLRDTSDILVAVTLRGLAALVCLLGPEPVVGGGRVKIFKSTTPGFTKNADITPEGSPVHSIYKQQMLLNQENVLAKGNLSGIKQANPSTLLHQQRSNSSTTFTNVDSRSSLTASVNGITGPKKPNVTNHNYINEPPEDWVGWSEPQPVMSKEQTVNVKVQREESVNHVIQDSEPWDDFGSSDELSEPASSSGPVSAHLEDGEIGFSPSYLTSALSLDSNSAGSLTDASKQTKGTSPPVLTYSKAPQAIEKKSVSGFGLGDEFTIRVKSTSRDPELDLFADMTPDIKVSSPAFNFTTVGTNTILAHYEDTNTEVPNKKEGSQTTAFSSKFAAAAAPEAEGEGWGEENDFSWEEDANTW